MIEIVRAGVATTFQDGGRPGYAHLGVTASGAVDVRLAALVNRLVGNADRAAVVETCGNLEILALTRVVVATSHELTPVALAAGDHYILPPGHHGRLWHYLAVRGGFAVSPVLGSRSSDTLSGLGPTPPQPGDRVVVGDDTTESTPVDVAPLADIGQFARITAGPRRDWFTEESWHSMTAANWTVTATSRVGVRLAGGRIERLVTGELASEGLVRGAIQVPLGGEPVMMLADHPTTGGYPVIAVVHPDDVAVVAQHAAGSSIRFRTPSTPTAPAGLLDA